MKKVNYFIIKRQPYYGEGWKPSKDYYKEPVRGYLIDDETAVRKIDRGMWQVDDLPTGQAIYKAATRELAVELFRSTYDKLIEHARSLVSYEQSLKRFREVQEIR